MIKAYKIYEINIYIPNARDMEKYIRSHSDEYLIFEVDEQDDRFKLCPGVITYKDTTYEDPFLALFFTSRESAFERFDKITRRLRNSDAEAYIAELYEREYNNMLIPMGTNARSRKVCKTVTYDTINYHAGDETDMEPIKQPVPDGLVHSTTAITATLNVQP